MAKQNGGRRTSDAPKCATFLPPSPPIPVDGVSRRSAAVARPRSPRDRSRTFRAARSPLAPNGTVKELTNARGSVVNVAASLERPVFFQFHSY